MKDSSIAKKGRLPSPRHSKVLSAPLRVSNALALPWIVFYQNNNKNDSVEEEFPLI